MDNLFLGIDIGGTKTEGLLVDHALNERSRVKQSTRSNSIDDLVLSIEGIMQNTLDAAGATVETITAITVGIPGQVDPETGTVQNAVNLGMSQYPLEQALAEKLDVPIILENDVRLAAIGAHQYFRRTDTLRNLAYVGIGTGISAGVILDGNLYRGSNGMAGEIGHMLVEPDGLLCNCGLHGCLETIVSGPAILGQAAGFLQLDDGSAGSAEIVYQAAQQGNAEAQALVQRVSFYMSRMLHWLLMTYDVEKIVLGGGVTNSGRLFLDPILREFTKLGEQSKLAEEMVSVDKIALLPPDYNAGLWGAVLLAKKHFDDLNVPTKEATPHLDSGS